MAKHLENLLHNSLVELAAVAILSAITGATIGAFVVGKVGTPTEYATLLSGFGGAVVGATISSLASLALAKQASSETLRRDAAARDAHDAANALRLMTKASLILSDLIAISRSIDESLSQANERHLTDQPLWRRVLPIVGGSETFTIEAAELAPLMSAKENNLVYASNDLFMQHASLTAAIETYSRTRLELKTVITRHAVLSTGILSSTLSQEDVERMAPYEMELESLISEIRARLPDLIRLAERVTYGIGPPMRRRYGDNFPVFVPPGSTDKGSPAA